eukprot:1188600-Prorocentrum_minimum.AAC.2
MDTTRWGCTNVRLTPDSSTLNAIWSQDTQLIRLENYVKNCRRMFGLCCLFAARQSSSGWEGGEEVRDTGEANSENYHQRRAAEICLQVRSVCFSSFVPSHHIAASHLRGSVNSQCVLALSSQMVQTNLGRPMTYFHNNQSPPFT